MSLDAVVFHCTCYMLATSLHADFSDMKILATSLHADLATPLHADAGDIAKCLLGSSNSLFLPTPASAAFSFLAQWLCLLSCEIGSMQLDCRSGTIHRGLGGTRPAAKLRRMLWCLFSNSKATSSQLMRNADWRLWQLRLLRKICSRS